MYLHLLGATTYPEGSQTTTYRGKRRKPMMTQLESAESLAVQPTGITEFLTDSSDLCWCRRVPDGPGAGPALLSAPSAPGWAIMAEEEGIVTEQMEEASGGLCWLSVLSCLLLACCYVGSLYVWRSDLPRWVLTSIRLKAIPRCLAALSYGCSTTNLECSTELDSSTVNAKSIKTSL